VDVVFISGSGLDGGGGWVGSTGSGMTYIHKLGNVLSSNLPRRCVFAVISQLTLLSWPFSQKPHTQPLVEKFRRREYYSARISLLDNSEPVA
jgi:hypothetical protein